jgi:antitoxin (DNA-binding transcriptional repressor) of toxin-antitoxin stability system
MSQRIGLGQLRNSAAYYFDRVAAGESFDVIRRGRTVAQIVPVSEAAFDGSGDVGCGGTATDDEMPCRCGDFADIGSAGASNVAR